MRGGADGCDAEPGNGRELELLPDLVSQVAEPAPFHEDTLQADLRRLADHLLETTRVEYVDEGVLLLTNPPAREHRAIVRLVVRAFERAIVQGLTPVEWAVNSENYQWELLDGTGRFYIPDVVVTRPDARTDEEERASIALIVEVTSPTSADTV
jgi:Uma2 family endonuclease